MQTEVCRAFLAGAVDFEFNALKKKKKEKMCYFDTELM